jgi:hypothetical protein
MVAVRTSKARKTLANLRVQFSNSAAIEAGKTFNVCEINDFVESKTKNMAISQNLEACN